MKILLINPSSKFINSHRLYRQFLPPIAPLGLAYIAAVLEGNGLEVGIIDMFANKIRPEQVLKVIKDTGPEVVGFSVLTPVADDVKELIGRLRLVDKKVKVVLGNTHASCFAHQLLEKGSADIVVRGEGEIPMLGLCKILSNGGNLAAVKGISYSVNGNIFHNPDGEITENLDDLSFPAFHLLDLDNYKEFPLLSVYNRRFLPISASRGCPYRCYFCSQDKVSKRPRYRDVKRVVAEMEYMHQRFKAGYFGFTDAYFPFSETSGIEFCEEIMRHNLHQRIRWITESRVDKVSKNLLKLMKKAGLRLIMYGIEVGSQKILDRINKKTTLQQARQALSYTKEAGILSLGLYMLGLPGETEQTCRETIEFAKELDTDIAKFNIAVPYPGSQFFKDCIRAKEIENPERFTSWYDSFRLNPDCAIFSNSGLDYRALVRLQRKAMVYYYLRFRIMLRSFLKGIATYRNLLYGGCWLSFMLFSNFLETILFSFRKQKGRCRASRQNRIFKGAES